MFDETFYLLAQLLDVTHPELDSVAERVKKSKVEQEDGEEVRANSDAHAGFWRPVSAWFISLLPIEDHW